MTRTRELFTVDRGQVLTGSLGEVEYCLLAIDLTGLHFPFISGRFKVGGKT